MAERKIIKKKFAIRVNQLGWHVNKIAMVLGIKKTEDAIFNLSTDADLERLAYLLECSVEFLVEDAAPIADNVPKLHITAFGNETIRPEIYNFIAKYNIPVDDDRLMIKDLGMPGKLYLEFINGEMRANSETIGFVERAFEAALMAHPEMNGALNSSIPEFGNSEDFRKAAAMNFASRMGMPGHSIYGMFNTPLVPPLFDPINNPFGMGMSAIDSAKHMMPTPLQPKEFKAEEDETYDANDITEPRTDKEILNDIADLLRKFTNMESFDKVKKLTEYIKGLKEIGID